MSLRAVRSGTESQSAIHNSPVRSPQPEDVDPAVALALADGDAAAWEHFCGGYELLMRYWCWAAGVPFQDIDDVVQAASERVWERVRQFEPNGRDGSFRGWLGTLVHHVIVDYFREFKKRSPSPELPQVYPVWVVGDGDDQSRVSPLWQLVEAEFGKNSYEMLWRSIVDEHSPAEIAKDMNLTQQALRKRKSRILAFLRERLEESTLGTTK